jgi:hypothetical protein
MQAAWINDAEFSGYFVAIDNGYYIDEGLQMTYLSGGPDVIPEAQLLSGRAQIALTTPDTTINLIQNEGVPLKIIGTQYQKSPLGIVSLRESNISEPIDLVGKTLAVPPINILSVQALLRLNGIDENSVNIVPYQYDPTPLVNHEVDATVDFTTNVPYAITLAGGEPSSFLMHDFGFTIYNDTVVVTEETLRYRKGWQENFKDTSLYPIMFRETHFQGNGRDIENEIFFNEAQRKLIETDNGIFHMTEEDIEGNIQALKSIGLAATRDMFVTDLLDDI